MTAGGVLATFLLMCLTLKASRHYKPTKHKPRYRSMLLSYLPTASSSATEGRYGKSNNRKNLTLRLMTSFRAPTRYILRYAVPGLAPLTVFLPMYACDIAVEQSSCSAPLVSSRMTVVLVVGSSYAIRSKHAQGWEGKGENSQPQSCVTSAFPA